MVQNTIDGVDDFLQQHERWLRIEARRQSSRVSGIVLDEHEVMSRAYAAAQRIADDVVAQRIEPRLFQPFVRRAVGHRIVDMLRHFDRPAGDKHRADLPDAIASPASTVAEDDTITAFLATLSKVDARLLRFLLDHGWTADAERSHGLPNTKWIARRLRMTEHTVAHSIARVRSSVVRWLRSRGHRLRDAHLRRLPGVRACEL